MILLLKIIAAFSFLLFLAMVATTPQYLFRIAWRNCFRRDGSWSIRSSFHELADFSNLLGSYLLMAVVFPLPIIWYTNCLVPLPERYEAMSESDFLVFAIVVVVFELLLMTRLFAGAIRTYRAELLRRAKRHNW